MARLCTKTVREPLCSLNGTALPDSKMPTFGENERRFYPGLPRKAKLMFSAAQAWRVRPRPEARCGPGLRRDLGRWWPSRRSVNIARIRRRACGSMRPLSIATLSPSSASRILAPAPRPCGGAGPDLPRPAAVEAPRCRRVRRGWWESRGAGLFSGPVYRKASRSGPAELAAFGCAIDILLSTRMTAPSWLRRHSWPIMVKLALTTRQKLPGAACSCPTRFRPG